MAFEESAMLEVVASIEDDVYAAEKRRRDPASAPRTDARQTRRQRARLDPEESFIIPEPPRLEPALPSLSSPLLQPNPLPQPPLPQSNLLLQPNPPPVAPPNLPPVSLNPPAPPPPAIVDLAVVDVVSIERCY